MQLLYSFGAKKDKIFIDMQDRSLVDELKFQFKNGGMHIRLIFINALFFLVIVLLGLIGKMSQNALEFDYFRTLIFSLHTDLSILKYTPYGFLTSIFSHFSFLHFLFNMVFLYFVGNLFRQFFSDRRLLHVYIWGGFFGGLLEVIAHVFTGGSSNVVGASGSIMAIFIAMAFYKPNLQVQLFGIFPVKLYLIALIYVISDFAQLSQFDGVAHFAHLGGAFLGFLSVQNLYSSRNIINWSETMQQKLVTSFSDWGKKKTKFKVEKGGSRVPKSDEAYNMEAKERQPKIDTILDKISKSGYESLTKAEKDFLFSQSNK